MDITAWTRCFTLCIAVMASTRADLVPAMVAHLHAVLKVQRSGGMAWLQFNWWSRRKMCVEGTPTWEQRNPWQLLPLITGQGTAAADSFEVSPQIPLPVCQPQQQSANTGAGPATKPPGVRPQPYRLPPSLRSQECATSSILPPWVVPMESIACLYTVVPTPTAVHRTTGEGTAQSHCLPTPPGEARGGGRLRVIPALAHTPMSATRQ